MVGTKRMRGRATPDEAGGHGKDFDSFGKQLMGFKQGFALIIFAY